MSILETNITKPFLSRSIDSMKKSPKRNSSVSMNGNALPLDAKHHSHVVQQSNNMLKDVITGIGTWTIDTTSPRHNKC